MYLQGWGPISDFEKEINSYLDFCEDNEEIEEYATDFYTTHNALFCVVTVYFKQDDEQ